MRRILITIVFVGLIALNACSELPEGSYFTAAGETGDALKSALHEIIDDHNVLPYTQPGNDDWHDRKNMDVWEALVYTDSSCPDINPECGSIRLLYLDEDRSIDQAAYYG